MKVFRHILRRRWSKRYISEHRHIHPIACKKRGGTSSSCKRWGAWIFNTRLVIQLFAINTESLRCLFSKCGLKRETTTRSHQPRAFPTSPQPAHMGAAFGARGALAQDNARRRRRRAATWGCVRTGRARVEAGRGCEADPRRGGRRSRRCRGGPVAKSRARASRSDFAARCGAVSSEGGLRLTKKFARPPSSHSGVGRRPLNQVSAAGVRRRAGGPPGWMGGGRVTGQTAGGWRVGVRATRRPEWMGGGAVDASAPRPILRCLGAHRSPQSGGTSGLGNAPKVARVGDESDQQVAHRRSKMWVRRGRVAVPWSPAPWSIRRVRGCEAGRSPHVCRPATPVVVRRAGVVSCQMCVRYLIMVFNTYGKCPKSTTGLFYV